MTTRIRFLLVALIPLTVASVSRADDLFDAMNKGDLDAMAKLLADDKTLANKARGTDLPLNYALRGNNFKVVKLLVDAGADVNATDANGFAAMSYAAKNPDPAVIKLLIAKGAKIDAPNKAIRGTPLLYAAGSGNKKVVALLLEEGARIEGAFVPDQLDPGGTPLYAAVAGGHLPTAEFLLNKGADPNLR